VLSWRSILHAVRARIAHLDFLEIYPNTGAQSGGDDKTYGNNPFHAGETAEWFSVRGSTGPGRPVKTPPELSLE